MVAGQATSPERAEPGSRKAHGLRKLILTFWLPLGCILSGAAAVWITACTPSQVGPEAQDKASEIAQWKSNGGPSATQIYGNPQKWKGAFTKITCKVDSVIMLDDGTNAANAICGEGVTATIDASMSNVDYRNLDDVEKAAKRQAQQMNEMSRKIQDMSLLLLVGDKVKSLDGGQVVTVVGPVLGTTPGTNAMGVAVYSPTVRADYIQ